MPFCWTWPVRLPADLRLRDLCPWASLTLAACQQLAPAPPDPWPGARWELQDSSVSVSLRGLSAVSADVVWASGAEGTWLRTPDGGRTWRSGTVDGAEDLDFRDIHALDARRAWLMAAGPGDSSRVYFTGDGGDSWTLQLRNQDAEGFFDSFAFWDERRAVLIGDPVDGRFTVFTTHDGGKGWTPTPMEDRPTAKEGEHAFAASGTAVTVVEGGRAWLVTGGLHSRAWRSVDYGLTWVDSGFLLSAGSSSTGAFSVAFRDALHGLVVGGDYERPEDGNIHMRSTYDGGETWRAAGRGPVGYRSAVASIPGEGSTSWVVVGSHGSDLTTDDGRSWVSLGAVGLHAAAAAPDGDAVFAVGSTGRIARLIPRSRSDGDVQSP